MKKSKRMLRRSILQCLYAHLQDAYGLEATAEQFVQDQMRIFTEQASEMGQTVAKAAMDAARPKS